MGMSFNYVIAVLAFGICVLGCWTCLILSAWLALLSPSNLLTRPKNAFTFTDFESFTQFRSFLLILINPSFIFCAVEQAISNYLHRKDVFLWLLLSSIALGCGGIWAPISVGQSCSQISISISRQILILITRQLLSSCFPPFFSSSELASLRVSLQA